MHPTFIMYALGIVAVEQVIGPYVIADVGCRALNMAFPATIEFNFGAWSAMGAFDEQHFSIR